MSSISFLNSSNFILIGTQNKSLGINISGPVLVFFKMQTSEPSNEFEPVFVKLSNIDVRISYGILDVTRNKDVVQWSRQTSTPITAVPILILYLNGKPYAKFNGTKNIPSLQNFITKALQTIPSASGQSFMQNNRPGNEHGNMYGPVSPSSGGGGYPQPGAQTYGSDYGVSSSRSQGPQKNVPDLGKAPSMKGALKGGGSPGYTSGGNYVEDDDDSRLMIPDSVTPWNAPWEADLQQNY
jgi:hypothetical protein